MIVKYFTYTTIDCTPVRTSLATPADVDIAEGVLSTCCALLAGNETLSRVTAEYPLDPTQEDGSCVLITVLR